MNSKAHKDTNDEMIDKEMKSRMGNVARLGSFKSPFVVQLLQPPKPLDNRPWFIRYWPRILFGIAIIIMFLFWNWYIIPQKNQPLQTLNIEPGNSIALGFSAPEYVFISNKCCIDVTVVNMSRCYFQRNDYVGFFPTCLIKYYFRK